MPLEVARLTGEDGRDATKGFEIDKLFRPKDGVKGVFASDLARVRFGVFGCMVVQVEKMKFNFFQLYALTT